MRTATKAAAPEVLQLEAERLNAVELQKVKPYDFVLNRKPPRIPGEPFASVGFALSKRYGRWEDARL